MYIAISESEKCKNQIKNEPGYILSVFKKRIDSQKLIEFKKRIVLGPPPPPTPQLTLSHSNSFNYYRHICVDSLRVIRKL